MDKKGILSWALICLGVIGLLMLLGEIATGSGLLGLVLFVIGIITLERKFDFFSFDDPLTKSKTVEDLFPDANKNKDG